MTDRTTSTTTAIPTRVSVEIDLFLTASYSLESITKNPVPAHMIQPCQAAEMLKVRALSPQSSCVLSQAEALAASAPLKNSGSNMRSAITWQRMIMRGSSAL